MGQRQNNRSAALLDAAAQLFAEQGYRATTIRDVTSAVGMGPGSSYYHFKTKADLLLAVYREGVSRVVESTRKRLEATPDDAWKRLEAAAVGHVEAVLAPSPYARVIVRVLPDDVPEIADALRAAREEYELIWKRLVDDLDLDVDTGLFRLLLLGAANSTQVWFRPGLHSPENIGAALVSFLREPLAKA